MKNDVVLKGRKEGYEKIPQQREVRFSLGNSREDLEALRRSVLVTEGLTKDFLRLFVAARGEEMRINSETFTVEHANEYMNQYLLGSGIKKADIPEAKKHWRELYKCIESLLLTQEGNKVAGTVFAPLYGDSKCMPTAGVADATYITVYDQKMVEIVSRYTGHKDEKKAEYAEGLQLSIDSRFVELADKEKKKADAALKKFHEEMLTDADFFQACAGFTAHPKVHKGAIGYLKRGDHYISWDELPEESYKDENGKTIRSKKDVVKTLLSNVERYRTEAKLRKPIIALRKLFRGPLLLPYNDQIIVSGEKLPAFFKSILSEVLSTLKGYKTQSDEFRTRGEAQLKAVKSAEKKMEKHSDFRIQVLRDYEEARAVETGCVNREYFIGPYEVKGLNRFLLELRMGNSIEDAHSKALESHPGSSDFMKHCMANLDAFKDDNGEWMAGPLLSSKERKAIKKAKKLKAKSKKGKAKKAEDAPKEEKPKWFWMDYVSYRQAAYKLVPFEEKGFQTNLQIDANAKGTRFETAGTNRSIGVLDWVGRTFTCKVPQIEKVDGVWHVNADNMLKLSLKVGDNKKLNPFIYQAKMKAKVRSEMGRSKESTFPVLITGDENNFGEILRIGGSVVVVKGDNILLRVFTERLVVTNNRLLEFVEGTLEKPCLVQAVDLGVKHPVAASYFLLKPGESEPRFIKSEFITTDFEHTGARNENGEDTFSLNAVKRRRKLLNGYLDRLHRINSKFGKVRRDKELSDDERRQECERLSEQYLEVLKRLLRKDAHFRRHRVPVWGIGFEGFVFYDDLRSAQTSQFTRLRWDKDGETVKSRLPRGFNKNRLIKRDQRKKEAMHFLAAKMRQNFEQLAQELGVEAGNFLMEDLDSLRVKKGRGKRHLNRALAQTRLHGLSDTIKTKYREKGHHVKMVYPEYTSSGVYEDGVVVPAARGFLYNPNNNGEMSEKQREQNTKHFGVEEWLPGQFEPKPYGGDFLCFMAKDKARTKHADWAASQNVFWFEFFRMVGKELPFIKATEMKAKVKGWEDSEVKPRFGENGEVLVPYPIEDIKPGSEMDETIEEKVHGYLVEYSDASVFWKVEKRLKSAETQGKSAYLLTDPTGRFLPKGVYVKSSAFRKALRIFMAHKHHQRKLAEYQRELHLAAE